MSASVDLISKQFWTTTIFSRTWSEHSVEARGIIEFLYGLKANAKSQIASGVAAGAKSALGLFESKFDLFAADHPGLNKLKAFIGESAQLAAVQVNSSEIDHRRLTVAVVDSWFHITNDGGFHDSHYHGGCSWCGIYYLQIGDSGKRIEGSAPNGGNRFYSPLRTGGGFKDFGNQYMEFNYVDVPLRDGMLVLFPSYLMHSGLPYRGERDRIVISFNSRVMLPGSPGLAS